MRKSPFISSGEGGVLRDTKNNNLQWFSVHLLLIFRSGRSRNNRINTDLSLLTFLSTVSSQKNTIKQYHHIPLSSTVILTAGSTNTGALYQTEESMLRTMPTFYWQFALVKLTHPDTFSGHCRTLGLPEEQLHSPAAHRHPHRSLRFLA